MKAQNVGETMTKHPYIASRKMLVTDAEQFMRECKIRHLPVIESDKIVGLASDRDLKKALGFRGPGTLLVEDVMTANPYCIKKGTALSEVARVMAEKRIGSAIIVDEKGASLGIFTTTDGMRILSQILSKGTLTKNELHEICYDDFPEYMSW
ncbi:MAG: CBS domain-containing protein [Pseudomonadota bacterium]|mgnify:CR=1 FL=1|nr:CBS domain-containing protein [Pseudomonadota bacterium]